MKFLASMIFLLMFTMIAQAQVVAQNGRRQQIAIGADGSVVAQQRAGILGLRTQQIAIGGNGAIAAQNGRRQQIAIGGGGTASFRGTQGYYYREQVRVAPIRVQPIQSYHYREQIRVAPIRSKVYYQEQLQIRRPQAIQAECVEQIRVQPQIVQREVYQPPAQVTERIVQPQIVERMEVRRQYLQECLPAPQPQQLNSGCGGTAQFRGGY